MFWSTVVLLLVLIGGMFLSVYTGKLTLPAAFAGGAIGLSVYMGAGFTGVTMLATFFVLGTLATSWKLTAKERFGLSEKDKGRRTSMQVLANAGVAGLLGSAALVFPQKSSIARMMLAASFASATADTLSSELGNVYGRRFYNILSFKPAQRGLDGVVSMEGTLAGIGGSFIIAALYALGSGDRSVFLIVFLSGLIGNLFDSILGASLQSAGRLNNDAVNFFNTVAAAATALALWLCV